MSERNRPPYDGMIITSSDPEIVVVQMARQSAEKWVTELAVLGMGMKAIARHPEVVEAGLTDGGAAAFSETAVKPEWIEAFQVFAQRLAEQILRRALDLPASTDEAS